MAFFNEFPFTRTYDSDLAWLIRRMKEVLARMDSVEERMAALEQLVADFIASLNIEQAIKDALQIMVQEGVFDDLLNQLFADYTQTINNRLDAQDLLIQQAVSNLTQRVDALANSLANYYTKNEIDNMLGGIGQLIDNLDKTIINSASKPRATIYVNANDGAGTNYEYVFGALNYFRGRFYINLSAAAQSGGSFNTNNSVIKRVTLLDNDYTNLSIPIAKLYDLFGLVRDIGSGNAIIYSGAAFAGMPPYSGGGGCITGSFTIQHTIRDNNNLFYKILNANYVVTPIMFNGLIDNLNVNGGSVGFPTNDELQEMITANT